MKTMDEWRVDFKSQNFVDIYKNCGLDKCYSAIGDWIASHREKILLAWWAEHGFKPGLAVCIEDRRDGEIRWYVQESTAEEQERAKTIRQHTQPAIARCGYCGAIVSGKCACEKCALEMENKLVQQQADA